TTDPNRSRIGVMLGNGNGTCQAAPTYSTVDPLLGFGRDPAAVAVGDFNGDGKLDIVTADKTDNTVSLLLGNGDGTFQAAHAITLHNATFPTALAVGDFNGDGKLDIATLNEGANDVSLLLGNGGRTCSQ